MEAERERKKVKGLYTHKTLGITCINAYSDNKSMRVCVCETEKVILNDRFSSSLPFCALGGPQEPLKDSFMMKEKMPGC